MRTYRGTRLIAFALAALLGLSVSLSAYADEDDPPSRPIRLGLIQGNVSLEPAGTSEWIEPYINRPLTIGDQLWSDSDGRAELQLDGSELRVAPNSSISLLNLTDSVTQLQLSGGTLIVHVRRLSDDESYEIDTPNLAFSVLRPGIYRLSVDPSGNFTTVVVRSGQGEVTGAGVAYTVYAHENDVFSGTDQLVENQQAEPGPDEFDSWSDQRDGRWDRSRSARYVSQDVVGYTDLDDYGDWNQVPEYGAVWVPRDVPPDWAPYRVGHWTYVAPWGYSWVDDSPWGFAPFHYGRWVAWNGRWGWVPAPPPPPAGVYVRPVYAPALVAWAAVGAGVAWFALGPREVYVPSYPVSRAYEENINVSNTVVNRTVVNNVYNTTIVNHTVINNVTYVNQRVPGAVVATSNQAFASGQKVSSHALPVTREQLASARVQPLAPAVVPEKQAVLGGARAASRTPPPAVARRAVVARMAPPAAPPSFEQRQEAIKANGGKPLFLAQTRQIAPAARPVPVKLAPAAHLMTPSVRPQASGGVPQNAASRPVSPPRAPSQSVATMPRTATTPAARAATHPDELPQQFKPHPASEANSVLERQQLQEQQRLAAQQIAARQRLQAQQEAEHHQVPAAAGPSPLEQQHHQQTQQLVEHQVQERLQLASRQEQQRRQQAAPTSADRKPPPERGGNQPPERNPH